MTTKTSLAIEGGARVTAIRHDVAGAAWTVVYAPGAGANINDPFGVYLCGRLEEQGIASARIQFPYMEAGRRSPDRPAVLEATWRAAIEALRPAETKLCVGGRSMGGRIASMVVAAGARADALALFAYPLHPPGRPQQLRTEHLPALTCRTLFCSGMNDAFGSPDELREAAALVKRSKLHLMDAADHGFAVPKASGRTKQDVWTEAADTLVKWLGA